MKSPFYWSAAGLALLALPATAEAAGITYDCDTAANHFSELYLPSIRVPFLVSGNVQFKRRAVSTTYSPSAQVRIAVSAASGEAHDRAGFALVLPLADVSGASPVQTLQYSRAKGNETLPPSTITKQGTVEPFKLSYDGSKVSVNVGNEAKSFLLKAAEPIVEIVCSTGEFLFTDLTIRPLR